MSTAPDAQEQRRQAAAWLVRLRNATVNYGDLAAFREWRRAPENEAAFQEMEGMWRRSGALVDDPDIQRALDDARRQREKPRRIVLAAGSIGAVIALSAFVLVMQPPTYSTAVGKDRVVALADGSRIRLDTDSRIRIAYSRSSRRVQLLRGRAFFDVAHDAARPFEVQAGEAIVRDIGTRFSVRRDAGVAATVVLVEGAVQVRAGGAKRWTLVPGQAISTARAQPPSPIDVQAATSWTAGRLTFHDTPLAVAVAEANRYTPSPIVLEGGDAVANASVDGAFVAGDTAAFVAAVCDLYDLRATRRSDGATVLSAKAAARTD